METTLWLLAATVVSIALITDLRWRRIPNWLKGAALLVGLAANLWLHGLSGVPLSLAGAALGFALLVPFYIQRAMGAGDVKLLAALGAILGPQTLLTVAVYGAIAGGLQSLFLIVAGGSLVAAARQVLVLRTLPARSGIKAPYAVAIAAGVYLAMLLPPVVR